MEIIIAADHNGFELKQLLVPWLKDKGYKATDLGPEDYDENDDYPDYGIKVARAVAEAPTQRRGIAICGSGAGVAVVAGKVAGIRAALIHDPRIAESAQRDDDINVLALGAKFITIEEAKEVIEAWLSTPFSGEERHVRRINKIKGYEQQHCEECNKNSA